MEWVICVLNNRLAIGERGPFQSRQAIEMLARHGIAAFGYTFNEYLKNARVRVSLRVAL